MNFPIGRGSRWAHVSLSWPGSPRQSLRRRPLGHDQSICRRAKRDRDKALYLARRSRRHHRQPKAWFPGAGGARLIIEQRNLGGPGECNQWRLRAQIARCYAINERPLRKIGAALCRDVGVQFVPVQVPKIADHLIDLLLIVSRARHSPLTAVLVPEQTKSKPPRPAD